MRRRLAKAEKVIGIGVQHQTQQQQQQQRRTEYTHTHNKEYKKKHNKIEQQQQKPIEGNRKTYHCFVQSQSIVRRVNNVIAGSLHV